VVFSLFGRKDKSSPARKESDERVAARPTADKPATAPSSGNVGTGYAAKLPSSLRAQEQARQVVQRINAIESEMESGGDVALMSRPMPPASAPAPRNPATTAGLAAAGLAAAGLDAPRQAQDLGVLDFKPSNIATNIPGEAGASTLLGDSMNALAVEIEGSRIAPEIEEAAILYANNQGEAAMALLKHVAEGENAAFTQQAWALLFDLYQVMGKQVEFDSLSIDYAARFESSPPTWNDVDAPLLAQPKPSNPSTVSFPEVLDANGVKLMEAVQKAAQKGRAVTLDFGQLKRVDANGATLLCKVFAAFRKAKLELVVHHSRRLLAAAEAGVEVGRRDPAESIWTLRLETLRLLGMQQEFDDVAIDYCVTYEISPPAWEPMPPQIRAEEAGEITLMAAAQGEVTGPSQDRFLLVGDATGSMQSELSSLDAFAEPLKEVFVDCRRLRRIDFAAAGNLMNLLVSLRQRGKSIVMHEPNNLVVALFSAMGLNEVTTINPRKF
jgi:anti-anti-sigma regulatory factor